MFSVLRDALIEWSETFPYLTSGKFQKNLSFRERFWLWNKAEFTIWNCKYIWIKSDLKITIGFPEYLILFGTNLKRIKTVISFNFDKCININWEFWIQFFLSQATEGNRKASQLPYTVWSYLAWSSQLTPSVKIQGTRDRNTEA